MKLRKITDFLWEIPAEGGMRVPGRIYASRGLLDDIRDDAAIKQVINVAHLPGIVGYSWAMPDVHMGYGFPIGGVAATEWNDEGVVSPGGVGYDINCGVRLMATGLKRGEMQKKIDKVVNRIFQRVPCGPLPQESGVGDLNRKEMNRVFEEGAGFVVDRGFGSTDDLGHCEENGAMPGADPDAVSERAIERGRRQLGSLGSGNHFLEIGYIAEVFDDDAARAFGIAQDDVTVLIHTGSRGLGHQVCTDFLKTMSAQASSLPYELPDRQLAAAPLQSPTGKAYLAAMAAAANYAWANRQALMVLAQRAIAEALGSPVGGLGFRLLYDVSHNIAKIENHVIAGKTKRVCVHRKGATRSLPPGDERVPARYRAVGQPVLVPGDMGTASFLCVGARVGADHPFYSTCHGAGRSLSRKAAVRRGKGRSIVDELRAKGITVAARNRKTLAEEMPEAYKDVTEVVNVMHSAALLTKVARIVPLGVIKG